MVSQRGKEVKSLLGAKDVHLYDKYFRAKEFQLLPRDLPYQSLVSALECQVQGPDQLRCLGQILPSVCFCRACELRMLSTVVKFYKTKKKEDYAREITNGSERLKVLPSTGKVFPGG